MMARSARYRQHKPRVLIVNAYFDDSRQLIARTQKIPKAMGPVHLAGALNPATCDVRLYCEQHSGPLRDRALFAWAEVLVLTGLLTSFDRMLQLTAYARTFNPSVVIIAGGSAIRALPSYATTFFDYCCLGDVEQLAEVVREVLGPDFVAEVIAPRLDLAYSMGAVGHIESSRYCNFRCSFCTITAEKRAYSAYSLAAVRRQVVQAGRRVLLFIDNNFYGNDHAFFLQRMDLLRELRTQGIFDSWGALVTSDFFLNEANLSLAKETGCMALFSGVESFDAGWLRSMNKRQNACADPLDSIRRCLDSGIVFLYGMIFDVTRRSVADVTEELDFIVNTPEIPLPSYISVPIPIPGTPLFYEAVENEMLLPNVRLRDLDGTNLTMRTVDPLAEVARFVSDIQTLRRWRTQAVKHTLQFCRRYRKSWDASQFRLAISNAALMTLGDAVTAPKAAFVPRSSKKRTHISSTEYLDRCYVPVFNVDTRFTSYFKPTMLTDDCGIVTSELAPDLLHRNLTRC